MGNVPGRIIVGVDDDFRVREAMMSLLESAGFAPHIFGSAEEFLRSESMGVAACLITDVRMPGVDGLELQRRVRQVSPSLPVIFLTAHSDEEIRRQAFAGGATHFLYKPFEGAELLGAIEASLPESA